MFLRWVIGCTIAVGCMWPGLAKAWTLQVPAKGGPIQLPDRWVLCGTGPSGWTVDASRSRLKPAADLAVGHASEVTLAPGLGDCIGGKTRDGLLLVTGDMPSFEVASVTLFADAGRLELRGQGLEGVRLAWRSGPAGDSDLCLNVDRQRGQDVCVIGVPRNLPADPRAVTLRWAPPGGRVGEDVVTFDGAGRRLSTEQTEVPIGRVIVTRVFAQTDTLDVATGEGRVELARPEAVSSVQCEGAHCDLAGKVVAVDAIAAHASQVTLRARLRPRVLFAEGDELTDKVSATLNIVRCPLAVVSGAPLRNASGTQVLVRMGSVCGKDASALRWTINGDTVEVTRVATVADAVYALLRVGRTARDRVRIEAVRKEDGSVLAVATENTREPPRVQTTLLLPSFGEIDFIPKNQEVQVSVSAAAGTGKLVPLSVPGAYEVTERDGRHYLRGVYASGGYTAVRFAYRDAGVPSEFSDVDFALLSDPVQRPIREASIPAPIGASSLSDKPIVAMYCRNEEGREVFIEPGTTPHIPFSERDSCRLVVHRDRIPEHSGQQRLNLEVSVTAAGGAERPEARLSQRLVLRHAPQQDVIWIRGARAQFDRINVRITHLIDEAFYIAPGGAAMELPSAQWSVVTENARFKFYATAAIPANLFRFSRDPGDLGTGPLSLNFGVLSRLTWLDSEGREGIVGLEAGMMGMGLATERERHLAIVGGLGISIPLGNVNQPTQAAVNIHAWVAYSVGERTALDAAGSPVRLNPWAFVFGPSITIGSVGVFL